MIFSKNTLKNWILLLSFLFFSSCFHKVYSQSIIDVHSYNLYHQDQYLFKNFVDYFDAKNFECGYTETLLKQMQPNGIHAKIVKQVFEYFTQDMTPYLELREKYLSQSCTSEEKDIFLFINQNFLKHDSSFVEISQDDNFSTKMACLNIGIRNYSNTISLIQLEQDLN